MTTKRKVIKDCIYGYINIPDLCLKFIDTPEFQRLRRVRQLGMVHYVYPSAVHTRFEHSLGVMHLAGKVVDQLRLTVDISDRTKNLIQLAGLYHDIGHFAYSHLFDTFLSRQEEDFPGQAPIFKLKDHEDRSIHFLHRVNSRLKLLTGEEEEFVQAVIRGDSIPDKKTAYLYQIVANKECGVDVDKMDYLRRDAYHTGLPGFQADYIILNAVVDSNNCLAFKKKAEEDLRDLFTTRRRMHKNVYQHHTTQKINKIYFCMMVRLGKELFKYGDQTDDYNLETLIRTSNEFTDLLDNLVTLNTRAFDHACDRCAGYSININVKESGNIDLVRFV